MKEEKNSKILTLLTILLIIIIIGVITILIVNNKKDNTNNNSNKDSFSNVVFDHDFVYNYVTSLYGNENNKIVVEENGDDYIAIVKDTNGELIIKLIFNKKDKSIIKDSSDMAISSGAVYDPSLEDGETDE